MLAAESIMGSHGAFVTVFAPAFATAFALDFATAFALAFATAFALAFARGRHDRMKTKENPHSGAEAEAGDVRCRVDNEFFCRRKEKSGDGGLQREEGRGGDVEGSGLLERLM